MSLFVIADTHLSLSCEKPMDIFKGWSDYTDRLKKNWNAVVGDRDTVVLPGDISWAMDMNGAREDLAFINSLPGTKILGKGNHDYWWRTMKKMESFVLENGFHSIKFLFNNAYPADGFAIAGSRGWFFDDNSANSDKIILREAGRLRRSLEQAKKLGGEGIVFTHYPVVYNDAVCRPLLDLLKEFEIKRCFFGHVHGIDASKNMRFQYEGIEFSLISADFLTFCPKKIM